MNRKHHYISYFFQFFGIFYLISSFIVFYLYAPGTIHIFKIQITLYSIIKPIKISIFLLLIGYLIRILEKRHIKDHQWWVPILFCSIVLINLSSPVKFAPDAKYSIHTARSIVTEFDIDLDEYSHLIKNDDYRIEYINGHIYPYFPIGPSIMAVPIASLFNNEMVLSKYEEIELITATLIISLASIFIFLISHRILGSIPFAALAVFIFCFCTPVWSTAGRGLWQHGPSLLLHSMAVYFIILAKDKPKYIKYLGIPLATAFIMRPTNAIPMLFLSIFVFIKYREYFFSYLTFSSLIFISFILFNLSVYSAFFPPYYMVSRVGHLDHFFDALIGNLISPGRGLIIFSPVLLFSFWGIIKKIKTDWFLGIIFSSIVISHWLVISSFPKWWGGHCFGPRFFADIIPYLIFFLLFFLKSIHSGQIHTQIVILFMLLSLASFLIHYQGATDFNTYLWNAEPTDIDIDTKRLWDWGDLQFLR